MRSRGSFGEDLGEEVEQEEITTHMDEAYAIRLLDALTPNGGQPHVRHHDGVHLLPAS